MNYSPKIMKEDLENNGFNLKKKYGQNFITDENTINSIVNKSFIDKDTLVIEVGPGAGSLTYKLCKEAGFVLCYEIDKTVQSILENNLKEYNNYKIIFNDFLKEDVNKELLDYNYKKVFLIANLPYYITTPIIIKIIENKINISKMVVMVQKEVGDRFKADVKTKSYNSLTVFLNYYYDVKKILDVSRNVFVPKPNVDSIVLEFTKSEKKYDVKDEKLFFKLVKDSFKQKRKNLRNNLREYDLEKIERTLNKLGFGLTSRAEELSIDVFVEMANSL